MRYLDLTLPTAAENLALDEALLDEAEAVGEGGEVLRFWEPREPLVVIGRSSKLEVEVRDQECRQAGIPVFRRSSGGAAIVAGPGCLMYALVLSYRQRPALRAVDHAHQFVLGRIVAGMAPIASGIRCRGTSDLVLGDCKFSGNSLRAKRDHFLYHGTLLYDFPLTVIGQYLATPPRQPAYRNGRSHGEFVVNLPLAAQAIRDALIDVFDAHEPYGQWPRGRTEQLARERYLPLTVT